MPKMLTAEKLINEFFGGEENLSLDKLYRMAKRKQIPAMKIEGRWFFPVDQVKEWIERQSQIETTITIEKSSGRQSAMPEIKE